jgi:hypothetical protein
MNRQPIITGTMMALCFLLSVVFAVGSFAAAGPYPTGSTGNQFTTSVGHASSSAFQLAKGGDGVSRGGRTNFQPVDELKGTNALPPDGLKRTNAPLPDGLKDMETPVHNGGGKRP